MFGMRRRELRCSAARLRVFITNLGAPKRQHHTFFRVRAVHGWQIARFKQASPQLNASCRNLQSRYFSSV